MWTMLSISGLCKVVEAAELLDSWGLGVVKDWLSRRVGAVARGCAGEGGGGGSCFGQWFVGDAVVTLCWSAGPMRMITIGLVFGPFNLVSRPSPLLNKL